MEIESYFDINQRHFYAKQRRPSKKLYYPHLRHLHHFLMFLFLIKKIKLKPCLRSEELVSYANNTKNVKLKDIVIQKGDG